MTGLGRIVFAVSVAAMGAFTLGFHGFAQQWSVVPGGIPFHGAFAMLAGALLLAGGVALLIPRVAAPAALVLAAYLLLRMLMLEVPNVVTDPLTEVNWESLGENMIELAGAWTIYAMLAHGRRFANARAGQILYALALLPIGLSHAFYLDHTAQIIPSWIPLHIPLAYFTGAAHFAAGVAILVGVLARMAATLEAAMVSLFTLLVWVPVVAAAPARSPYWGEILVSTMISGAAWAIAESLRDKPWSFSRGV